MKGVGGFEYEVLRAEGGRKYIELRNSELIGSKCDNDAGAFASIIETPSESEQGTLAKTTVVDGVKYGLSLALPTCTNNESLLKSYQDAFSKHPKFQGLALESSFYVLISYLLIPFLS
jgi:hypothetical protein